jgi:probable phosphoglycerate mutase
MSTRVLLVRHGQSEWNALGRWQGQADPPLSDIGRAQARSAARSLGAASSAGNGRRGLDAIVSSDLQRALETAAIISAELGIGPVTVEPALRERDAGEWSGLSRPAIEERYPGWLSPLGDKHSAFSPASDGARRPPGWEPDESVLARALTALHNIRASAGDGEVLGVTHGGLIYTVEHHLSATVSRLANGEGRWLDVDDDDLRLGERVLLVDDHDAPVTIPKQL